MKGFENNLANVANYNELKELLELHFPTLDTRDDDGHFWVSSGSEWLRIELRSDGNHKVFVPNVHTQSAPVGAGKVLSATQLRAELVRLSIHHKGIRP